MANEPEFIKHDYGKPKWSLMPWDAARQVVAVLTFGAQKYPPRNWEAGAAYSRYFDALQRHVTAWWAGETNDPETGLHHLAHAGCCMLFLLAYELRGIGKDDRK